MIKKNEIYEVTIEGVTNVGEGVCRIDGFVVFVPNSVDGDILQIKIINVKKGYGYARVEKIITPSKNRVTPRCEVYKRCGGCNLMHINYKAQLELKSGFILDNIRKIAKIDWEQKVECIGMDNPYRYRNKMVFPIGKNADGRAIFGFYTQRSHNIIEFADCYIGDSVCVNIAKTVVDFMNEFGVKPYDEGTNKGDIRRVFVRSGAQSGEIIAVIVSNVRDVLELPVLTERVRKVSPDIKSIILNINKGANNNVLGKENVTLWGKSTIEDTLCGNKFKISPNSFYQVNPTQTKVLYEKAIEFADIKKGDRVVDLYSGIGTITLMAAKVAKQVIGVEIVEDAVKNAKENAKVNNVDNVEFFCGDAKEIAASLQKEGKKADVVILDPPRKGSDEGTLKAIADMGCKKIVYVSCDSATMARDIAYLKTLGFTLQKAAGVDMFPHTVHVESIILMTYCGSEGEK